MDNLVRTVDNEFSQTSDPTENLAICYLVLSIIGSFMQMQQSITCWTLTWKFTKFIICGNILFQTGFKSHPGQFNLLFQNYIVFGIDSNIFENKNLFTLLRVGFQRKSSDFFLYFNRKIYNGLRDIVISIDKMNSCGKNANHKNSINNSPWNNKNWMSAW